MVLKRLDRALAILLTLGYLAFLVSSVFSRRDWNDIVAYGLPGANLVLHGELVLPQLGGQFGFDRYWLFNAPFTVLACVPAFLLGGVGRMPFLSGIVLIGLASLWAFSAACRRLFDLQSWALSVWLALAFLGTRGMATAELYNQNYAIAALPALLLTFMPVSRQHAGFARPWWQWLMAGALPLVHLVLAPAAVVWLLVALRERHREPVADRQATAGPIAFAGAAAVSLAWYGRVKPFLTQLWPHISDGDFRFKGPFSGFLETSASPVASAPSWALNGLVVLAAAAVVVSAVRAGRSRESVAAAVPAALVVVLLLPLDAARGWLYYTFFLVALGPIVIASAAGRTFRQAAVVALAVIAALNLGVSSRLDRARPDWTTTAMADQFVVERTKPTDRITLGPPFVFSAATLVPTRDVRRVVPEPYFLEDFDEQAWRADLSECCDLYLGEEEFFRRSVTRRPAGGPLFQDAAIEHLDFRGRPVILARRR